MPRWRPPTALDMINKRRADRMFKEGGWGPQLTFPVTRADGSKLFVQFRMPHTMELQTREAIEPPTVFAGDLTGDGEELAQFKVEFEDGRAPAVEDFPDPGQPWKHQEVTKLSDKAIQVMRISEEPRLQMIYSLHTQFGALTFAFEAKQEGMFGPKARDMYRKIVETTWIGTKKRPY